MIHPSASPDPETPHPVRDPHSAPAADDLAPPADGAVDHYAFAPEQPASEIPPAPPPEPVAENPPPAPGEEENPAIPAAESDQVRQLEERIRRLESALTTMQDVHEKELATAKEAQAAVPVANVAPTAPLATVVPPNAEPGLREKAGQWMQAGKRMLAVAPLATAAAIPMAKMAVSALNAQTGPSSLRHPWVLIEMYQEMRAILRMYLDRSYRPSVQAWVVPVVALSFMICSYFFVGAIPIVGPVLDKLVDLGFAYVSYKVLVREAERHQQHLALQQQPLHQPLG
jgi:hypothetical protein